MKSRSITVAAAVILLVMATLHPERLVYSLGGFVLGVAFTTSLPWFARWLERWVDRASSGASYWCRRCRIGTNHPRCWSCQRGDKTSRNHRPGAITGLA